MAGIRGKNIIRTNIVVMPNSIADIICPEFEDCDGLFYRFRRTEFMAASGAISISETLSPLKRISCSGCKYCNFLSKALEESMFMKVPVNKDPGNHGDVYRLDAVNYTRDYETGVLDEFELKFTNTSGGKDEGES